MAGEVEEVGLRLTLKEQRQVAAGLKDTEQQLDQVGDAGDRAGRKASRGMRMMTAGLRGVGRGFGVVGGWVKRGVLTIAAAGIATIGTALYKGFNRLTGIENATAKLTGLGHNAKSVSAIMDNALASVRGTAFGMDEAATTAAGAVAAGVRPGKDLERTLKLVADAATIGGTSMGEMGSIFNKVATSNKIQADVMNQLSDRGIPIVQLLGNELGVTGEQVLEMSKAGKIGFDVFRRAMDRGMGGAALKSGNTTTGALKNVGAALGRLGAVLGGGAFPMIRRVAKQAIIVIDGLGERLAPLMERMNASLGPKMADKIQGSGKRILRWIDRQADSAERLYRAYNKSGGIDGVLDALRGKIPSGNAASLAGIAGGLGEIGESVKGVDWDQVQANLGHGVTDTLTVFATVIGFAADHVDTLAKYLPALVAGFAAYRVAQAAANTAALFSLPIQVVQLASQIAHTRALRANTAATAGNTVVEKKSIVGKMASVTATVAQTVATKAAAGAQRVMNVVMRANPIGLVITAIALLVGGLILAYKKSDTFRGMVDGLWNNVLKPFGSWLKGVLISGIILVGKAFLAFGRFGVMAFRLLLTAAFKTFDGILSAAEKGLGWVPKFGPKIKSARAAFNEFGDSTIDKLKRVEDRMRAASDSLDKLARPRSTTFTITTIHHTDTTSGNDFVGGPRRPGEGPGGGASGSGGGGGRDLPPPRIQMPPPPTPNHTRPHTFDPAKMPTSKFDVYLDGKQVAARVVRHVSAAGARG